MVPGITRVFTTVQGLLWKHSWMFGCHLHCAYVERRCEEKSKTAKQFMLVSFGLVLKWHITTINSNEIKMNWKQNRELLQFCSVQPCQQRHSTFSHQKYFRFTLQNIRSKIQWEDLGNSIYLIGFVGWLLHEMQHDGIWELVFLSV